MHLYWVLNLQVQYFDTKWNTSTTSAHKHTHSFKSCRNITPSSLKFLSHTKLTCISKLENGRAVLMEHIHSFVWICCLRRSHKLPGARRPALACSVRTATNCCGRGASPPLHMLASALAYHMHAQPWDKCHDGSRCITKKLRSELIVIVQKGGDGPHQSVSIASLSFWRGRFESTGNYIWYQVCGDDGGKLRCWTLHAVRWRSWLLPPPIPDFNRGAQSRRCSVSC